MTQHILLILAIILGSSFLFTGLHMILRQLRRRIDIRRCSRDGKLLDEIAYVKHQKGKVAEAYLPKDAQKIIGRIRIDKSREKAIVQLRQSSLDDETPDPIFKRCGYIGEDGFIYAQPVKDGPVARIGYVARPSRPNVPCLEGKRNWKSLWLHSYLDVFRFKQSFVENYDKAPESSVKIDASSISGNGVCVDESGLSQEEILTEIKRRMVLVEGGTFLMGAKPNALGTVETDGKTRGMVEENESPQHEVTLNKYYIGRFPVTQAEWMAVMGETPSGSLQDPNNPVSPVSWNQCQEFIQRLNGLTGLQFSLPTEAQWEFAARGGQNGKGTTFSGSDSFSDVGWGDHKHPVGQKAPNELGLYDMSGLVREWCSDIWGRYSEEPQVDPTGPDAESPLVMKTPDGDLCRVVRSPSGNETVTNRKGETPDLAKDFKSYGLRLVCSQVDVEVASASPSPRPEPQPDNTNLADKAELVARCDLQGFGFPKEGMITSESRAAAYALFASNNPRQEYEEYYSDPKYGWKDAALLASLVYVVLYILYYLINTSILQRPLVGMMFWGIPVLYGFYYAVWGLVRSIKIERAEGGNSFQPQLDLLNKSLGQQWIEAGALALCAIAFPLSRFLFDLDFYPLIFAIMTGFIINKTVTDVAAPWVVKKSYSDRATNEPAEDEDGELETNQPPAGDIVCSYDWDLDYEGRSLHGNLSIRFDPDIIHEERQNNPFFSQIPIRSMTVVENMFDMLCHRKDYMERVRFLARYINDTATKADLPEHIKLQFALDFIQEPNIRFVLDKNSERIQNALEYMRLPDETLFDKEGDYDCKTFLAAMLFFSMGYDVLFLYSSKHEHYAVAVEERYNWTESIWTEDSGKFKIPYQDERTFAEKSYVICETVADHFRVGELLQGLDADDFDQKEHFFHQEQNAELRDIVYRHYDWDLDQGDAAPAVHGMVVLSFDSSIVTDLRNNNPFNQDVDVDDVQRISRMVGLLVSKPKYTSNLTEIAGVILNRFPNLGLQGVQFALNFVRNSNIAFRHNRESASINFVEHYLRYPDELLIDKEGDFNSRVFFSAMLLNTLGMDVQLLLSEDNVTWAIAANLAEGKVLCHRVPGDELVAELTEKDIFG